MSNDFENQNNGAENGVENNQNLYQQDYGNQQGYTNPYQQDYGNQQGYTNPYQQDYGNQQGYTNPYQQDYGKQQSYTNPYQQDYSSQQDFSGQYNNYNGQYGDYNGQYTSYNKVPLDKNGKPLANNFGLKLTFSILEMICCNLISLVLGIISCVLTCKANTAYKEGRWEDFKSNAKTSTITLWIGFAGFVLEVILVIAACVAMGFSFATIASEIDEDYAYYDDDEDYYYYDDDDDITTDIKEDTEKDAEESTEVETEAVAEVSTEEDSEMEVPYPIIPLTAGEGFTDPTVTFNGSTISLPLTYADFTAVTGCSLDSEDAAEILDAEDYDIVSVYNDAGDEVCDLWVMNLTDTELAMSDCYVVGVIAYNDGYTVTPDLVIQSGITFASTQEEIKAVLGEPTYIDSDSENGITYESWSWDYANPNASYFDELLIEFINGEVYCLEVDNSTMQ